MSRKGAPREHKREPLSTKGTPLSRRGTPLSTREHKNQKRGTRNKERGSTSSPVPPAYEKQNKRVVNTGIPLTWVGLSLCGKRGRHPQVSS